MQSQYLSSMFSNYATNIVTDFLKKNWKVPAAKPENCVQNDFHKLSSDQNIFSIAPIQINENVIKHMNVCWILLIYSIEFYKADLDIWELTIWKSIWISTQVALPT